MAQNENNPNARKKSKRASSSKAEDPAKVREYVGYLRELHKLQGSLLAKLSKAV